MDEPGSEDDFGSEEDFGPLEWAEPLHGALVVLSRSDAESVFRPPERRMGGPGAPIVDGVVTTWAQEDCRGLRLTTPQGWACTALTQGADGALLVVTHLDGGGAPALLDAARALPDSAFEDTDHTFAIGDGGLVLFDSAARWDMVRDDLHVALDAAPGTYAVQVAAEAGDKPRRLRVIRMVATDAPS